MSAPLAIAPELYRALFQVSSDAAILLDRDGVVLDANPACLRRCGLERDQFFGRQLTKEFPDAAADLQAAFGRAARTGSPSSCAGSGSSSMPLLERPALVVPVHDGSGRLAGFLMLAPAEAASRQQTQPKPGVDEGALEAAPTEHPGYGELVGQVQRYAAELEERVAERTADLAARNAELDAYAHTVAHDIGTPLAAISSYAELLLEQVVPLSEAERAAALETISRNARRANNIARELLLLASLRDMEVEYERLNMAAVVAEVLDRLAYWIKAANAEVRLPEQWPAALGYGPWIEEVWVNYMSNALKYGGQPPLLALNTQVQPNGTVRFSVRDNGDGVLPKDRERLFTPFTRLSQVKTRGYGLGLSIVRRIMNKLGGEVGVEDAPEGGSIFYFTLQAGDQ